MGNNEPTVTRTLRAALRMGEDYVTLEETISLPLDASDDDIEQAVQLGWRIYTQQREALEGQIANLREHYTPASVEPPASERQRNYIAALQSDLTWSDEQLESYASEQQVDMAAMSRTQASQFIDRLKRVAEERVAYHAAGPPTPPHASSPPASDAPLSERQYQVLLKLARGRDIDLEAETQQRFSKSARELSNAQAGALIQEWQK